MPIRFANPIDDFAFKRVFGDKNHKDVTIDFFNNILGRKHGNLIKDISFNDPFVPYFAKEAPKSRQKRISDNSYSIFDIYCIDEKNRNYLIEVQRKAKKEFLKPLVKQLKQQKRGVEKLRPIIVFAVLDFQIFPDSVDCVNRQLMVNTSDHACYLNLMEFCFIELPKFIKKEDELSSDIDRWLFFLKHAAECLKRPQKIAKKNVAIRKAFEIVRGSLDVNNH